MHSHTYIYTIAYISKAHRHVFVIFKHKSVQLSGHDHTHTKDHGAEELCVRSTSQAGKMSGKGLCNSKLLLNELIHH